MKKSIFTSLFIAFIMLLLLSTFIVSLNIPNPPMLVTSSLWALFLVFITFMIYRTGKVSVYRSVFFVVYGFAFVLTFITHLIEERGGMALTQEIVNANQTPLCPVAIPMLILPAIIKHILIFPTKLYGGPYGGFYPILFLWLLAVVVLGRGWCSWGCFYGGIDEGFSKILPKAKIAAKKMNPKLRYIPFAILIVTVFWAFIALEPVYCRWLCPLKLVTEYREINSMVTYIQAVIFITLGMSLLIILPILTKKRVQCGLFCPLGALQSVAGQINPYRVRIDCEKCTGCGKCKDVCPVFAITDEHLKNKKIGITCSRCGKCMDACPKGAIDYALLGVPFSTEKRIFSGKVSQSGNSFVRKMAAGPLRVLDDLIDGRTIYVFSALLFGAILSGRTVSEALLRLYTLIVKGTVLLK